MSLSTPQTALARLSNLPPGPSPAFSLATTPLPQITFSSTLPEAASFADYVIFDESTTYNASTPPTDPISLPPRPLRWTETTPPPILPPPPAIPPTLAPAPLPTSGSSISGFSGQFFHIREQGEQGDASAKVGAELHPLDYWELDTGAAWTMTPRKELINDVRAAPINKVCSSSGHALKVAGAGRAAFKGADGKPVVLRNVLLVPDLKANLISLRKLAKAGVSISADGARMYNGQLRNRVLLDMHESKDVYRSMWQLPALAWYSGGQAGEGSASQGQCNAVGGVGVKVSARSGETDWATAHRRLGHVAMP
ncbi:unnamed protein product [Closterium sp. NIES-54]